MTVKHTRFKRFKGWLLSVILIDLITLITRLIESVFSKDKQILTVFFTENNYADNSIVFSEERFIINYLIRLLASVMCWYLFEQSCALSRPSPPRVS